MNDNERPVPAPTIPDLVPLQPSKPLLHKVFFGNNVFWEGLRIVLYILMVVAFSYVVHWFRHHFFPRPPLDIHAPFEPVGQTISRGLAFIIMVIAALIMARIEREKWGHYGLPLRRAVSKEFWFGLLWGFGGATLVMGGLWLAGAYRIDGLALAGAAAWKYAALWGVMFMVVGLLEEFTLRGYLQYALASGIGFWPAAVILSGVFLAGHISNPGENWMGLTDVFVIGMFLAFTLWRTGDLWFAVGLHAAWDWGLTYFYSVPNSGTVAIGHLFNVRTQGPTWLSGGSAGPEGSIINLIFDLLCFVIFAMIYKKRKWIGMDERRRAHASLIGTSQGNQSVVLDTSSLTR
jgi:membrane protease YdiL (CAAX protease family)